jgi:Fe2+ or Zn2+ uptake regulation protein
MTTDTASLIKSWRSQLRQNGYRLTAPRKAVLEIVAESQESLNPTEIYDLARARYSRLGLVTVYRTLEKLEELQLVQRVHRPDNCHAFIAHTEGHEHLLLCQDCGRVAYFSGDELGDLIEDVQEQSGYRIDNHWLQFFGLCDSCQHAV